MDGTFCWIACRYKLAIHHTTFLLSRLQALRAVVRVESCIVSFSIIQAAVLPPAMVRVPLVEALVKPQGR